MHMYICMFAYVCIHGGLKLMTSLIVTLFIDILFFFPTEPKAH